MAVDFVVSIGSKIAEYLIQPIGRQFGYVIYYKSNLQSLKNEVRKLEEKRGAVQLSVDEAKRKGELIGPDVRGWLARVTEPSKEATSILEADDTEANKKCMDGWWCPNLKSRYSLSRKAKKKVEEVVELHRGGNFTRVSYTPPPPGIESRPIQGIRGFKSRRLIAEEVMEALNDDRVNMIGICGMGGVGKTTMVKEVAKKAKEQNLFDDVVMAVVSQTPEVRKIQGEIAGALGFEFKQGIESGRADELREQLKRRKSILVVLDDVWKRIELNDIGIPSRDAHEHCKILLTSRSKDVCNDMNTQRNIQVGVLHDEEARNLFKEMAGISVDTTSPDLHSTQMEVAKECGGLPLAIVTVGRALKDKPKHSWDSALEQLRKSIVENIRGVEKEVFNPLKLSYDSIDSEEAKKCFLLCSLYPEDSHIPIEDLVRFGFGLGLFKYINSVGVARARVHGYIDDLIKCYLLMDSGKDGFVKMHDVIRDVSISIASREENSFMVRCDEALEEWPEHDRRKNYAVISMRFRGQRKGILDNLEFPKLQLLRLDFDQVDFDVEFLTEDPESWYQGIKQLKVVALSRMLIRSLPTSVRCLTNLQTLSLRDCKLIDQDVSAIGTLENLEILSFVGSNIKELPREIGKLTRLKLLDLLECTVERIPYGVLSSLSKLEELYVGLSFTGWDVVVPGKEISTNACVAELASLPNLVVLAITVPETKFLVWPKGVALLQKVKTFYVYLGKPSKVYDFDISYCFSNRLVNDFDISYPFSNRLVKDFDISFPFSNRLVLKSLDISGRKEGVLKLLLKGARYLELNSVTGVGKMLCDLDDEGGFEHLTELNLHSCSGLEGLIDTKDGRLAKEAFSALKVLRLRDLSELTHLWKGPTHHHECLRNLTSVCIFDCDKLESVFSLSVVRNLVQLQELSIWGDNQTLTEVIVSDGGGEDDGIVPAIVDRIEFPKLTELLLDKLPNFTAFSKAMNPIELPRLEKLELLRIPKLDRLYPAFSKDALSSIEELDIDTMDNLIQIWPGDLQANLRTIWLRSCHKLLNILLPSNLIKCMQHLVRLGVEECESLEVAFDIGGLNVGSEGQGAIALPCLAMLKLDDLPNLTHVWANYSPGIRGFQKLTTLLVISCNSLRILFSPSVAKLLVMLKELKITGCEVMEAVIAWEQGVDVEVTTNTIVFPQLTSVELKDLPNLTSFCPQAYTVEGSFLQKVKVSGCPKMMELPLPFQRVIDEVME